MLTCDNCYIDLCAVLVCDNTATITFPATAPVDGEYKVIIEYLNTAKSYTVTYSAGSPITLTMTGLNEQYCYEGYIVAPDGSAVPLFDGVNGYGSFRFCTHPEIETAVI